MGLMKKVKQNMSKKDVQKNVTSENITMLNIEKINEDKSQVRKHFDKDSLEELAQSIKEHGVLSPIIVRSNGDKYIIIAGERRYKASIMAEKNEIPAIIKDVGNSKAKSIQLIENLQREDITPIETAIALSQLVNHGTTQEEISKSLGMSKGNVSKYCSISRISNLLMIQEKNPHAGFDDLYRASKESNTKKRNRMISAIIGEGEESKKTDAPENEIDIEKAWTLLKKEVRKNPENLLKYVSKKKIGNLISQEN